MIYKVLGIICSIIAGVSLILLIIFSWDNLIAIRGLQIENLKINYPYMIVAFTFPFIAVLLFFKEDK